MQMPGPAEKQDLTGKNKCAVINYKNTKIYTGVGAYRCTVLVETFRQRKRKLETNLYVSKTTPTNSKVDLSTKQLLAF